MGNSGLNFCYKSKRVQWWVKEKITETLYNNLYIPHIFLLGDTPVQYKTILRLSVYTKRFILILKETFEKEREFKMEGLYS